MPPEQPSSPKWSQVLVDFIVEWTKVQMPPAVVDQEYWTMYFNGSLMKKGAGAGWSSFRPSGYA